MKNVIFRKRLLPLVLLFVMLVNCTGCAVQWAKTPNEENTQSKGREKVSQAENKKISEVTAEEAEVPEEKVNDIEEKEETSKLVKEAEVSSPKQPEAQKQPEADNGAKTQEQPEIQPEPVPQEQKKPQPEAQEKPKAQTEPKPETEKQPEVNQLPEEEEEIPDQIDMSLLGNWYMSNEEYDEMVSNSNVGVGAE